MAKQTSEIVSTEDVNILETIVNFSMENAENLTIIDVERAKAVI